MTAISDHSKLLVLTGGARATSGVTPAQLALATDALQTQDASVAVPVTRDGAETAFLWAQGKLIGGIGLTPALGRSATDIVAPRTRIGVPAVPVPGGYVDSSGLAAPAVSPRLVEAIEAQRPFQAYSDGRTLWRWRGQMAKLRTGSLSGKARILILGDSWVQMSYISAAIRDVIGLSLAGDGWHPPFEFGSLTGASVSRSSGWASVDGSTQSTFPYGCGPDGQGITTEAADQTITWSNLTATAITIHSFRFGGTWRYRIDGGGWNTVAEGIGGTRRRTVISGLSDTAHTLEIDTTGNAGVVSIAGIYSTRDTAGLEIVRIGDAGMRSAMGANYTSYLSEVIYDWPPDLVITILGTNDQTTGDSHPGTYARYLTTLTGIFRAAQAAVGIVHVIPPATDPTQIGGGVSQPLKSYARRMRLEALADGREFLSAYDLWGTWSQSSDLGLMLDWGHLNTTGARCLADQINHYFIGA